MTEKKWYHKKNKKDKTEHHADKHKPGFSGDSQPVAGETSSFEKVSSEKMPKSRSDIDFDKTKQEMPQSFKHQKPFSYQ